MAFVFNGLKRSRGPGAESFGGPGVEDLNGGVEILDTPVT